VVLVAPVQTADHPFTKPLGLPDLQGLT
jgi:hypothetical protein